MKPERLHELVAAAEAAGLDAAALKTARDAHVGDSVRWLERAARETEGTTHHEVFARALREERRPRGADPGARLELRVEVARAGDTLQLTYIDRLGRSVGEATSRFSRQLLEFPDRRAFNALFPDHEAVLRALTGHPELRRYALRVRVVTEDSELSRVRWARATAGGALLASGVAPWTFEVTSRPSNDDVRLRETPHVAIVHAPDAELTAKRLEDRLRLLSSRYAGTARLRTVRAGGPLSEGWDLVVALGAHVGTLNAHVAWLQGAEAGGAATCTIAHDLPPERAADVVGDWLTDVVARAADPVVAAHVVAHRCGQLGALRCAATYRDWHATELKREYKPPVKLVLDRKDQRKEAHFRLTEMLKTPGRRLEVLLGSAVPDRELRVLGPTLEHYLTETAPHVELAYVEVQPPHLLRAEVDPLSAWLTSLGDGLKLRGTIDSKRCAEALVAARNRLGDAGVLFLDCGLLAAPAVPHVQAWFDALHAICSRVPSRVRVLAYLGAEARQLDPWPELVEDANEAHDDTWYEVTALDPLPILDRADLRRFFAGEGEEGPSKQTRGPLAMALLSEHNGAYAPTYEALELGRRDGWDQLLTRLTQKGDR